MALCRFKIEDGLYEEFKEYCDKNNIVPSVLFRSIIRSTMDGKYDRELYHREWVATADKRYTVTDGHRWPLVATENDADGHRESELNTSMATGMATENDADGHQWPSVATEDINTSHDIEEANTSMAIILKDEGYTL